MRRRVFKSVLAAGVCAVPLLAGAPALAQSSVEARLNALEAQVASLRAQLDAERIRNAQPVTIEPARIEALERRAAEPVPEGFRVGNTNIRLGGFGKVDGVFSRFNDGPVPPTAGGGQSAREYYIPSAIPVGGTAEDARFTGHAKQTRLTITATPAIQGHTVQAYVEMDFASAPGTQGTQNVSNAYDLGLRRAYLVYDNWLIGQDWTTFQNTASLPETTDFIGNTDGTVFVRQPMVRHTRKVNDGFSWVWALENPETVTQGIGTGPSGGQDDDFIPDAVLRFNFTRPHSSFSIAGIARQLKVENPGYEEQATGVGLSVAGKIAFGQNWRHDVRFMLTGGEGIGRYVGIAAIPDALAIQTATRRDLEAVSMFAGSLTGRFALGPRTRTNIGYAFQSADLSAALVPGSTTESTWSLFGNLFFSPVPGTDLGIEVRHGVRSLVSGADGSLDRVHFVAKRGF